jgi:hypothetical protein
MNPYQPYAPPAAPAGPPQMGYASGASSGVSDLVLEMLRQTRPWVIFLGILSFIGCALVLFVGVGTAIVGLVAASATRSPATALLGLVYIPLGLVYLYPGLKLVKYGSAIGRLMETRAMADLEDAMLQQKSMWKFSGIAAIVVIVLYIFLFVVVIGAGVAGMSKAFGP